MASLCSGVYTSLDVFLSVLSRVLELFLVLSAYGVLRNLVY